LIPVFNYLYFRNHDANFVENICRTQVTKVAVSIINSDKLRRSYEDLYFVVTFWDIGSLF